MLNRKKAKNIKDLISKVDKELKRHNLWEDIRKGIEHISFLIIENKALLKELWKVEDISQLPKVKFFIDSKREINAYIQKAKDENYDYYVVLYEGLILVSYNYAGNVILKNFPQTINNPELYEKLRQSLFYYWITLILSHEFSHLFRKHLEVVNENKFMEFRKRKKSLLVSNIFNPQSGRLYVNSSKYLETDADRYAGIIYIGIFAKTLDKLREETGIELENLLINLLIRGTIKFFDMFMILHKDINDTHPCPLSRTISFLAGCAEGIHNNSSILNYDKEKFVDLIKIENLVHIMQIYDFEDPKKLHMCVQESLYIIDTYNTEIEKLLGKIKNE